MKISTISTAAFLAGVTTLAVTLPVLASGPGNVPSVEVTTSVQKNQNSGSDTHLD